MKIIFISDQFFPRTSADSEQIVSSLSALGKKAEVTLLSAGYFFKKLPEIKELEEFYHKKCTFSLDFVKHFFPSIRGIEKISFAIRAAFKIRKRSIDIAYTRNIPIVIAILFFTKVPIVFESYRPWPSRNIISNWFFKRMAKSEKFLGVVLHSKFAGNSFSEVGFKNSELLLAHNAFDFESYDSTSDPKHIREKYNIPLTSFLVTYTGRVNKAKGVDRLFHLAEEFPKITFLIVGSEKEGEIEKKAAKYPNISILGWKNKKEVFQILRASDVLYIPTSTQARDVHGNTVLPLKTFIYKASGTSILAPDMQDIREVLTHNENAYLVSPDNFEEEKKGLKKLIKNEDLRFRIAEKAKEEMRLITWEKRAEKILKFIEINMN